MGVRDGLGTLYSPDGIWVEGEWRSGFLAIEKMFGEGSLEQKVGDIVEFYSDSQEKQKLIEDFREMMEGN